MVRGGHGWPSDSIAKVRWRDTPACARRNCCAAKRAALRTKVFWTSNGLSGTSSSR